MSSIVLHHHGPYCWHCAALRCQPRQACCVWSLLMALFHIALVQHTDVTIVSFGIVLPFAVSEDSLQVWSRSLLLAVNCASLSAKTTSQTREYRQSSGPYNTNIYRSWRGGRGGGLGGGRGGIGTSERTRGRDSRGRQTGGKCGWGNGGVSEYKSNLNKQSSSSGCKPRS